MSTKLIVTNYKNFKCGVKLNEGELVNIRFRPNEDVQIGDIYKVKIAEILPNDSGAFVTYGKGDQRGFFKRINLPNGDKVHLVSIRKIDTLEKTSLISFTVSDKCSTVVWEYLSYLYFVDVSNLNIFIRSKSDINQFPFVEFNSTFKIFVVCNNKFCRHGIAPFKK